MPRRPRSFLPGLPQHVVQRGNNRGACFFAEDDYRFYLHWLGRIAEREGCRLHAWVLMSNHVHLLLTPASADAAPRLMQTLGRRYVQYINRTYQRSGTLWEGRYKTSLVDAEDYLLKCCRYIETNPVRAGMVGHPADYPWSSARCHFLGERSDLLQDHPCYLALGKDDKARRESYAALCRVDLDEEDVAAIRKPSLAGQVLGGERFAAQVGEALGMRLAPPPRGRPKRGGGGLPGEQGNLGL